MHIFQYFLLQHRCFWPGIVMEREDGSDGDAASLFLLAAFVGSSAGSSRKH